MAEFSTPPIEPTVLGYRLDPESGVATFSPAGPVLTRRLSELAGVFGDEDARREQAEADDPVVYTVTSSPVPELPGELPQSITTIEPGDVAGECFLTKGHLHTDHQGEIYLSLAGEGGLLLHDGTSARFLPLAVGEIGYIPPGWAHRSVNLGREAYSFLAVYPGSAGHDYQWVLDHGMGHRVYRDPTTGHRLVADQPSAGPQPTTAGTV